MYNCYFNAQVCIIVILTFMPGRVAVDVVSGHGTECIKTKEAAVTVYNLSHPLVTEWPDE